MHLCNIYLGCALFIVSSASSAAVYKWVDKEGKTHFSQTPPPVSEDVQASMQHDSRRGVSSIKPLRNGDTIYCGRLKIINIALSDEILKENLQIAIDDWVAERNKLDQQRLNLPASTTLKMRRRIDAEYAEYDCRTRWAHGKLKWFNSFTYQSQKTYHSLDDEYQRLKSRQEEECSTDPKKLGKTMLIGKEANEWGKCYNKYKYKMRDVKAKMKENRRSLGDSQ